MSRTYVRGIVASYSHVFSTISTGSQNPPRRNRTNNHGSPPPII
ncbi:hypothetical protein HMPREF9566_01695 [Cutibacterium acnes HL045PA1]|nr:hypothetical protein HMPREF9574_02311 [Cutibacterium acnes HL074PA1]EFS56738.1 hypothetical protein HMPREF9593_00888 [Cutibacterium acnes HL046PA2]EFS65880.1 hypothetical protein HMPREF9612_01849 [Cutibacterium acnes HL063PA2]EFT20601.1 hypothetical protein HMPREF9566_01695 [Cutibacterium acnes HL045PA1]EGE89571.1 hypothetical protein HMPREF9570_02421 [Cutibacterium acnes HL043PA1]EGE91696.1 hypothetical protein HMPREF9571_02027 [Cutibacterium acnes HL043PA2]EGF73012.1 hypothetical protein